MDLFEMKKQTNDLLENADLLIKQYDRILEDLSRIYMVIGKTNSEESKKLKTLIDNYNSQISTMKREYNENSSKILNYIDASNQNLELLKENLKFTGDTFNERVENTDL